MNYTVNKLLKRIEDANVCDYSMDFYTQVEEDRYAIEFDTKNITNKDVVANYLYFLIKEVSETKEGEYPYTYKIEDKGNGKYKIEFSIGDVLYYGDPVAIIALEEYGLIGYNKLYFDKYSRGFVLNAFDMIEVIQSIVSIKKIK